MLGTPRQELDNMVDKYTWTYTSDFHLERQGELFFRLCLLLFECGCCDDSISNSAKSSVRMPKINVPDVLKIQFFPEHACPYPGPRGFLVFFIGKFCDANLLKESLWDQGSMPLTPYFEPFKYTQTFTNDHCFKFPFIKQSRQCQLWSRTSLSIFMTKHLSKTA